MFILCLLWRRLRAHVTPPSASPPYRAHYATAADGLNIKFEYFNTVFDRDVGSEPWLRPASRLQRWRIMVPERKRRQVSALEV